MDEREQIELYAFGKLSGEPLRDLEARLAADPNFAAMVRQEADILRALRYSREVDKLREQLKIIENEEAVSEPAADLSTFEKLTNLEHPGKHITRVRTLRWLVAAAALALLATAVLFLKNRKEVLTPEQIFAAHFKPPSSLNSAERRGETDGQTTQTEFLKQWSKAKNLYEKGDYSAALEALKSLAAFGESIDYQNDINFQVGLTALRTSDFRLAILFFEKVADSSFRTEKPWYLALAQLRAGEMEAAKNGFGQIAGSNSPFAEDAQVILEQLSER